MSKTTWIVQKILRSPSPSVLALKRAVATVGRPLVEVDVVPFTDAIPEIPDDIEPPIAIYGMNTMIQNTLRHSKWRRGLFFDQAAFEPMTYTKQLGDLMLNADAELLTCEELAESGLHPTDRFFLRPNDDSKMFAGRVMDFREFWRWYRRMDESDDVDLEADTLVLCSGLKTIVREHRMFMLDGKVITSSQYLPEAKRFTPPEVIEFVEHVALQYAPVAAFVCDIATTHDGLKVIEFNCINGSGFYEANVEAVVRSLSLWQEAHH